MKTIASLKGPAFLRACNRCRHAVEDFLTETKVLDLRKVVPAIPEGATDEEKEKLLAAQAKKNISAMIDRCLEEYPEATYELLLSMIVPDRKMVELEDPTTHVVVKVPSEEFEDPDGFDLVSAFLEIVTTQKVVDFFIKLAKQAPSIMDR